MSFFYDRPLWAPTLMPHIQGRRNVWNYELGGSSNVVGIIFPLVGIGLIDLPKPGGANRSPCPPSVPKSLYWKQCCWIRYVYVLKSTGRITMHMWLCVSSWFWNCRGKRVLQHFWNELRSRNPSFCLTTIIRQSSSLLHHPLSDFFFLFVGRQGCHNNK
jgi:hypothetical protein